MNKTPRKHLMENSDSYFKADSARLFKDKYRKNKFTAKDKTNLHQLGCDAYDGAVDLTNSQVMAYIR